MCRLYYAICKRWGPERLTLSAYAWKLHMQGRSWARNRIDGAWLFWFSQEQHCHQQFQREIANTP